MASLGEVVSTALTGGDAPVFQSAPKEIKALAKQSSDTSANVEAVNAKVDALTDLFTKFLESQTANVAKVADVEPDTKAEKAPAKSTKTKTETDTPTKDPEGKLDPTDEKVGSVQKGQ